MLPEDRIYSGGPIESIWNSQGELPLTRKEFVGKERIKILLREGPVRFVVANYGEPLRWVPLEDRFLFWKNEVQPHLIEPDEDAFLEDSPGQYCYLGTEWSGLGEVPTVLLVMLH